MKRLIFSILICVFAWGVKAQEIDALFVSMPDKNIPQLEDAWRKDLVDLYKSGKEARLKNTMNGFSTLKNLTSDYLLLQVTDRSTIEMKLLPLVNNTNVICLVKTVNGPVPDSRIEFFTTEWEPLAASDLFTPVEANWFIKEDADKQYGFSGCCFPFGYGFDTVQFKSRKSDINGNIHNTSVSGPGRP